MLGDSKVVAPWYERNRCVLTIGAATAFSLLGDQALYAVLPVYYESLGITALQVGVLLSANRWIRLVTNDWAHRLGQGSAQKWFFLLAFALGVVTTAAYTLYSTFSILLVMRLAWGLAWSFIRHLGVQAILNDVPDERTGWTMGMYNGISRAGSVAGLLGGALLVDIFGFVNGILCLALFSLVSLPLAWAGHQGYRLLESQHSGDAPWTLLVAGFAVGIVGPGFVMSTLGAVLVDYISDDGMLSAATLTGGVLAVRYVMDSGAAPWLGSLTDTFGIRRAGISYFAVGGLALLLSVMDLPLFVFIAAILTFFVCGTGLQAGLAGRAGRLGSGAFARYVTAGDLGAATGPLLGWWIVDSFDDPSWSLAIGGITYLLAAGVLARVAKTTL
jgi:MFS family permease